MRITKTTTATSAIVTGSAPARSGIPIRARIESCHSALFQTKRTTTTAATAAAAQVAFRRTRRLASGSCSHSHVQSSSTPSP